VIGGGGEVSCPIQSVARNGNLGLRVFLPICDEEPRLGDVDRRPQPALAFLCA